MASDDVSALHERLFTIDTHIDTPTGSLVRPGWSFGECHSRAVDGTQCDLPRMRAGGADAMVFAMFVSQGARTDEGHRMACDLVWSYLDRTLQVLHDNRAECGLARNAEEGLRLNREGRRAIFLSLENAYSLGRDVGNVQRFYEAGIRMIGLTHMLHNDLADSSTDPRGPQWNGLSPLGREVVAECNRLGIVVDASHASDDVLRQLLERSSAPVILSHSDCRAICDHPRNVGDDLLRALAAKGGVIQINALPISLVTAPGSRRTEAIAEVLMKYKDTPLTSEVLAASDRDYDDVCAANPNPRATLDDFVRHVEHAVEIAGIDHVGIGCDFDGGGGVIGLNDVSEYPNLTRVLAARGWKEDALAKLWGGNTLRLLRAVQC